MTEDVQTVDPQIPSGGEPSVHIPPPPPPPPSDELFVSTPHVASSQTQPVQTPQATLAPAPSPVVQVVIPEEPIEEPAETIDLDPRLLMYLMSSRYRSSIETVQKNFSLNTDDVALISDLDRMAMAGKIDLHAYLDALRDELTSLSKDQQDDLFAQLLADRFVPLGDLIKPTAVEVARAEELVLPAVPHYRIYEKPLTYSGAATEVAAMAGFPLLGGPVRERLRELIVSKVKGVRVDAQVRDVLTRGIDFGGLGLDQKMAEKTIVSINDIIGRAKVISEDEYAVWLSEQARKKAEPEQRTGAPLSAEEQEIETIKQRMNVSTQPATLLEKAVDTTISRVAYQSTDEYLKRRFRNVVSSRLRDVRSALELRQLLVRDVKVGGLGLPAPEADAIAKQVEAAYQEFRSSIAEDEKKKIEVQLDEQKRKVEDRRQREAEEHAKWFEEKIRARKATETQKGEMASQMRRIMGGATSPMVPEPAPSHPIDAKEKAIETTKFGPMAKPETAPIAKPEVKVSAATAQLAGAAPTVRSKMDDIKYAGPQLVGLVGELKSLTVAEFRRLAKDPQQAAQKIRQKVETLSGESFEKRVEGIRAFQASPLQGAYMTLVGESFRSGRAIAALAEEKRKAGGDNLSPEEVAAIITLNSTLHF